MSEPPRTAWSAPLEEKPLLVLITAPTNAGGRAMADVHGESATAQELFCWKTQRSLQAWEIRFTPSCPHKRSTVFRAAVPQCVKYLNVNTKMYLYIYGVIANEERIRRQKNIIKSKGSLFMLCILKYIGHTWCKYDLFSSSRGQFSFQKKMKISWANIWLQPDQLQQQCYISLINNTRISYVIWYSSCSLGISSAGFLPLSSRSCGPESSRASQDLEG